MTKKQYFCTLKTNQQTNQLINNEVDDTKKKLKEDHQYLKVETKMIPDLERQINLKRDIDKLLKEKSIIHLTKLIKRKDEEIINFYNESVVKKEFNIEVIEKKIEKVLNSIVSHYTEVKNYKLKNIDINSGSENTKKLEPLLKKYEKVYKKTIDSLIHDIKILIDLLKDVVNYLNNLNELIIEKKTQFESIFNKEPLLVNEELKVKICSSYSDFIECVEKFNGHLFQIKVLISKKHDFKKLKNIQNKINNLIDKKNPKIDFDKAINDINLFEQLQQSKDIDNLYLPALCKDQMKFNIVFIFDITSSMGEYIESFRNNFFDIIKQIKNKCPLAVLYLGFIGYKDIQDLELGDEYIDLDLSLFYDEIYNKIKNIQAEGGDDIPEDVAGAFEMALKKSWNKSNKGTDVIFLITDSPCHGTKYHDLNQKIEMYKDKFPNGHYEGDDEEYKREDIEKLVEKFVEKNINLVCLDIHENTQKMFKMFEDKYKAGNKNNLFSVSKEDLAKCIIQKMSELYSLKEEEILKILAEEKNEIKAK